MTSNERRTKHWRGLSLVSTIALATATTSCVSSMGHGLLAERLRGGFQFCVEWAYQGSDAACVGPLTPEQAAQRNHTRIIRSNGTAVRIEYRNGRGGFAPSGESAFAEIVRDGGVQRWTWKDRWGTPTQVWLQSAERFEDMTPWGAPNRSKKGDGVAIKRVQNEAGFIVRGTSVDAAGSPAWENGVHVTVSVVDTRGYVTDKRYFGFDETPVERNGTHRTVSRVGELGCRTEERRFDKHGRPLPPAAGVAIVRRTCDALGRTTSERYFDGTETPMLDRKGVHGEDLEYDERGALVLSRSVGLDGRPSAGNQGVVATRTEVDDRGDPVRRRYFGQTGAPAPDQGGGFGIAYARHLSGAVVRLTHLDQEGRPMRTSGRWASASYSYSPTGKLLETRFFDEDGAPTTDLTGAARIRREYDSHDLLVEEAYLDEKGRPKKISRGYALLRVERDAEGMEMARKYFDTEGATVQVRKVRSVRVAHVNVERSTTTRSKAEAQRLAETLATRVGRGERWEQVATELGLDAPADLVAGPGGLVGAVETALKGADAGAPPRVADTPNGFFVVQRIE